MARGARRHNMQNTEEVVYDSQEEHDEWPESHSSEGNPDRSLCSRDNSPGVFDDAEALPPLGTGSVSKFVQHDISRLESNDGDLPLNRDNPRQSAVTSPANDVPLSVPGISPTPPRRALRARKPEQKMPYTLDLMRHRDQFRRRGLKPVHNPDIRFSALEDDDQYQADEEEEVLDKDERYIPQKNVDGPAPKRRCVQQPNEAPGDNFELNIRIGPQKFLDPRKFDIYRQEDNVPRVDFQGEVAFNKSFLICRYPITHLIQMMDYLYLLKYVTLDAQILLGKQSRQYLFLLKLAVQESILPHEQSWSHLEAIIQM